jgi:uncharacterized protein YndB with AHSA1/START domain
MTRVFSAPRRLVFEAHTKPELLKRWLLGPPGWEMVVCNAAHKAGDPYRYEWRNTSTGHQFGIGGVCREFAPPERIVCSEVMDGQPGEALNTTTFVEENGKTTLTVNMLFESREIRDMALKSGMERGVAASYDRLDEILARSQQHASSQGAA